jgi:hypothetical protein
LATKRELIEAIAGRYQEAGRVEKKTILDEFVQERQLTSFRIMAKRIRRKYPSTLRAENVEF